MANAVEMSTMRKMVAQLNRYRHEYYNLNAPSVADDVYDYMAMYMPKVMQPVVRSDGRWKESYHRSRP